MSSLPEDYHNAVIQLQLSSPECLQSSESSVVFTLPDQSQRLTWAGDSGATGVISGQYPECVRSPATTVHSYFTQLDHLVSSLIINIAGDDKTQWSDHDNHVRGDFSSLHYKV